jgi:transporter, YbiR family
MLHFIPFSVIVIIIVFILIAVRQIGKFRVKIWQAVLAGAIAVIITGQISIPAALPYINLTVIIYLIAIFILGGALTESNYIHYIFYKIFKHHFFLHNFAINLYPLSLSYMLLHIPQR